MVQKERRKYIRIPCHSLISYTVLDKDGQSDSAQADFFHCRNVSSQGILFNAKEPIEKKTVLNLKLRIDASAGSHADIVIISEVMRCTESASSGKWDIAVKICCFEKSKKDFFTEWVKNNLKAFSRPPLDSDTSPDAPKPCV